MKINHNLMTRLSGMIEVLRIGSSPLPYKERNGKFLGLPTPRTGRCSFTSVSGQ